MNKRILLLILAGLLCTGCTSLADEKQNADTDAQTVTDSRVITDVNNRKITVPRKINSVICINVGALRFTAYLDAIDLVSGIELNEQEQSISKPYNYVNHNTLSALPVIGNNGETYDEEIAALSPDVIVTSLDRDAAETLQKKSGIPVVTIPLVDDVFDDSCYQTLEILGKLYQKEARAEELTAYIKTLENDLAGRTAHIPPEKKETVYVGGISFKGMHGFDGTEAGYAPFAAIGAANIADAASRPGPFNIDPEEVLKADPDIIFLDHNGMSLITEDYQKNPDYYQSLSAVKNQRVFSQISFRFSAVNIELALADAYYAGSVIYPDHFQDIDPKQKADEIFTTFLNCQLYDELAANGYDFRPIDLEK